MLLSTIASGANIFITIAVILIALGAGLTTVDFLRTKDKEKQMEKGEESSSE